MLPIVDFYIRNQINHNENEAGQQLRIQRRFLRDNSNPFDLPEARFIELFRLNKNLMQHLIIMLTPFLNRPIYRTGITVEMKIFAALRFYSTGCYQRAVGEDYNLGLSQTSVHRCIHEVTECIDNHLAPEYITFPTTQREFNTSKELFMQQFHFPGVIGAIDGTHVAILKPAIEEHNFVNRKGYHSLNVQIICNSNLRILNVNANYPGATHDSFIWRQSQIREYMNRLYNQGNRGCWLIGDSGYPLEPYLMTPFLNPAENSPEARYNRRHCSARNCVERCIGVLKMRFRCILKERTARYTPEFVGKLVNTCATLHNMCIDHGIPFANEIDHPEPLHNNDNNYGHHQNVINEGRHIRQTIVDRYCR